MRTVGEHLMEFAKEHGADSGEFIRLRFNEHLHCLSERYKRLVTEVLLRLPEEWDSHADWEMREGRHEVIDPEGICPDKYYAGSRLFEGDDDDVLQIWETILVADMLDGLSDQAIRGVIVHELGHIASALPTDPAIRNDSICEDRADAIAMWWGFEEELKATKHEDSIIKR
jgi:hypothetical protein